MSATKSTTTSSSDEKIAQQRERAEVLRLAGNDAYGTGDFERALKLYQESVALCPQAKTFSNAAASLHRLGQYDEASKMAEQCTKTDPDWAKGWWRRGVAAELQKDFHSAIGHYKKAVKLDGMSQAFKKHLDDIKKRLNVIEKENAPTGTLVPMADDNEEMDLMDTPSVKALTRGKALVTARHGAAAVNIYNLYTLYANLQVQSNMDYPTSEQYLMRGLTLWICGLKCAICDLSMSISPQTMAYGFDLKRRLNQLSHQELVRAETVLGGIPTGEAMNAMISGFAHLGGTQIFLEMAPGRICPQPQALNRYIAFQILAQLCCIQKWVVVLEHQEYDFGRDMKCAPAVLEAYSTFYANLQAPAPLDMDNKSRDCTPQEIVDYIKEQVQAGRTWAEGGIRAYAACMYRGTILYGTVCRSMGQQYARAYGCYKWAREFVTLLDQEFHVTEAGTFDQMGNFFRPSLRVGIMMAELDLLSGLGMGKVDGPHSAEMVLSLCLEISRMANNIEQIDHNGALELGGERFRSAEEDVAFRRKPLAKAHSQIAALVNNLQRDCSQERFRQIVVDQKLIEDEENVDPYAIVAEHYRISAENELPDADEGSILWWAYAATTAQADTTSGRTLGDLRYAIRTALANEEARDIDLFGDNLQKNGEYESIAKLTADHFDGKPDSFVFPPLKFIWDDDANRAVLQLDNTVICDDFDQYRRNELKMFEHHKREERKATLMDTTDLEKKFGKVEAVGPPSLATLSIRELHKADAPFARSKTDGDAIIQEAMESANEWS